MDRSDEALISDVRRNVDQLRRSSLISLILVLLGASIVLSSVWYSATRLRPLELEVVQAKAELAPLQSAVDAASVDLQETRRLLAEARSAASKLRAEIESLREDQVALLDFVGEVAKKSQVHTLDPDVDWDAVAESVASVSGHRKRALLVGILMAWKDIPFRLGGNRASGFDSPRFLSFVLSSVGVSVEPRRSERMSDALMRRFVRVEKPRPGDLAFFRGNVGSFGFLCLTASDGGLNAVGVGTLQTGEPLMILKLSNVNTAVYPFVGFFRVTYDDEAK